MSDSVSDLVIALATHDDAAAMVEVIHAAFGARPPLDPPSTAVDETTETVRDLLSAGAGIYATVGGQPAGSIVITGLSETLATFQRVSVHPDFQRHGVASAMVEAALSYAAELGFRRVELFARAEFAELIRFWQHRGFTAVRPEAHGLILGRPLPTALVVPTADDMHAVGARLAGLLRAGDVVIASGELGAGKTTLTQGLAAGLGVRGQVISPTFVLSRIHQGPAGRPDLVHVDAYRLGDAAELDDLDLDATVARSVTVVEWGEGIAEGLAEERLEIQIVRSGGRANDVTGDFTGDFNDTLTGDLAEELDPRTVIITTVGKRWRAVDLAAWLEGAATGDGPGVVANGSHG